MSTIPTKQIDGDVSIGRNITAGGDVTLRGSAKICHNLKVEGWLEAPNIKGPNKGLFYHEKDLKNYYPNPRAGWWALVGDCLPARLFFVVDGKWEETGNYCGEPDIDASEYNRVVHELDGKIDRALESGEQNALDIETIRSEVAQIITNAATKNEVADMKLDLESVSEAAQEALTTANAANTSVALLKARHEKDVAQINAAHDRDFSGLNMRIEKLKESDVAIDASIKEQADRLTAQEGVSAANSRHIDELASNLESVSDELSEGVGDAQILARNALDNAAIYPFGGIYPSVGSMPDDGRIGFITSLKRFAKNPDNALLGEYNTEDGKARADRLFRDGNRLYRVGSDGLLEEYANSLLGATVENLGHEVVGIWDEINAVKELMTSRGRIFAALTKMGYDEKDIETFLYLNTHFPCGISTDMVEYAALQWEQFYDINKNKTEREISNWIDEDIEGTHPTPCYILPKYPTEWENNEEAPDPRAVLGYVREPTYAPFLETSRNQHWLYDARIQLSGGLNYQGTNTVQVASLGNIIAIDKILGNIQRVYFKGNCRLKWIGELNITREWDGNFAFCDCYYFHYAFNIDWTMAYECKSIFSLDSNYTRQPLVLQSPITLNVDLESPHINIFNNRILRNQVIEITGNTETMWYQPLLNCQLCECDLTICPPLTVFSSSTGAGSNYIMGKGVNRVKFDLAEKLANYHTGDAVLNLFNSCTADTKQDDVIWEVETPMMKESILVKSGSLATCNGKEMYLPLKWGKNWQLGRINYYELIPEAIHHYVVGYDWEEALNRSVNSLYNRSAAHQMWTEQLKHGNIPCTLIVMSQWQFDLLTEETKANATSKGYTITVI